MVLPSLVVIHVPGEFTLGILLLYHLVLEVFVFLLFLVDITGIISTSTRSMILPQAFTKPAKIMSTMSAMDVITTLVLLNKGTTTWTWLGVGLKPIEIFVIILLFICPCFNLYTVARLVIFLATVKAHVIATAALSSSFHAVVGY